MRACSNNPKLLSLLLAARAHDDDAATLLHATSRTTFFRACSHINTRTQNTQHTARVHTRTHTHATHTHTRAHAHTTHTNGHARAFANVSTHARACTTYLHATHASRPHPTPNPPRCLSRARVHLDPPGEAERASVTQRLHARSSCP
jgi:hypothetical protein